MAVLLACNMAITHDDVTAAIHARKLSVLSSSPDEWPILMAFASTKSLRIRESKNPENLRIGNPENPENLRIGNRENPENPENREYSRI